MESLDLSPSRILYTQDSMSDHFGNTPIWETYEDLLFDNITVYDIPEIEVMPHESEPDTWWAVTGNRRLYLYKALEAVGAISTVPVLERPQGSGFRRFTTDCDGEDIRVRGIGSDEVEAKIERRNEKWRRQRSRRGRRKNTALIYYDHLSSRMSRVRL